MTSGFLFHEVRFSSTLAHINRSGATTGPLQHPTNPSFTQHTAHQRDVTDVQTGPISSPGQEDMSPIIWLLEERQAVQKALPTGNWLMGWGCWDQPRVGHRDHVTDVGWHLGKLLHHFRTCLEEPERALSSLEALPLRRPEFICAIICPCCIGVTDMRVISRCISDPVGMPRWRRVLVRLSRSLDMGRGEVAVTKTKQNIQLHWLLKPNRGVKAKRQQNQLRNLLEYAQRKCNPIHSRKLLPFKASWLPT